MKLPFMPFYVGDWQKDPNLRRSGHFLKGVWLDCMCLMWEAEDRGVLASGGEPWSDQEIAAAIGGETSVVLACLSELTLKGIAHRNQSGALYSKRMVRDEQKRKLCSEAGKRGGNPKLMKTLKGEVKGEVKGRVKPKPTPSESYSESESEVLKPPPNARGSPRIPGSIEEMQRWAALWGGTPEQAAAFFNHFEAVGWVTKNNVPIVDALPKFKTWVEDDRAKADQAKAAGGKQNAVKDPFWKDRARLEIIDRELAGIRGRGSVTATATIYSEKDLAELRRFNAERKEITDRLKL